MPDISEGLTESGQSTARGDLSDSAFNAMLAQQVGKQSEPAEPGQAYRETQRELHASGDEIGRALLDDEPGLSPSIEAGLTVEGEKRSSKYGFTPAEEREIREQYEEVRRDPSFEANLREGKLLSRQSAQRNAEGEAAIGELAVIDFREALEDAETNEDILAAALELRRRAPNEYLSELERIDDEEAEQYDDDEMEDFESPSVELNDRVERELAAERIRAYEYLARELTHKIAQDEVNKRRSYLNAWASENGLSGAEAKKRIAEAEEFARGMIGVELGTITNQEEFEHFFRASDATLRENQHAHRQRSIQQSILDTPSTSISDGLEQFTPLGWKKLNGVDLNAALGPPTPNPERTAQRAIGRSVRPQEIRQAVAAPEATSVVDGITVKTERGVLRGQRALEETTGAREQFERERAEARAQALSFLG